MQKSSCILFVINFEAEGAAMNIPIQMRPIYDEIAEVISEYCGNF